MANIKIAQLTNLLTLNDTDILIVETATTTGKMTVSKLNELLGIQLNIPLGGVVESGSNGNGSYIKFADGTMICSGTISTSIASNTALASGGGFRTSSIVRDYPQAFTDRPVISCSLEEYGSNNSIGVMVAPLPANPLTQCFAQWRTVSGDSTARERSAGYIAIGRWK
jgi:hypothetical protein